MGRVPNWMWVALVTVSLVVVIVVGRPTKTNQKSLQVLTFPVYATYDFSSATVPGEVKVPFRPDAWTGVTLPAAVVFRTDPPNDVEIVFIDGSRYIDGPGKQVWYGLKRGVFKIRGLTEAGILKISLEKKT
jgi:hypothetical protein